MVEQHDPAHAGVKAGRVVGLLTALLVVISLFRVQESFVGRLVSLIELTGIDPGPSVTVYFYLYVGGAALGRYALCYIVGSLIGVVYDWLDDPPVAVLAGIALLAGLIDGAAAAGDTRSILIGLGYVLAWLCYVPVFFWLFEDGDRGIRRFEER
ncbi:hypothetical protein SAMN05216226_11049 [Halovenus aranensis]|jgi:hypothetical protein|uniref:Uncharacterized protein n=1 Tax=Halovenus aranensis TaxID=890420 RepID=A0A1G8X0J5_9EURY|nr:hypothetical protein [Halovenus aranensis]SDJ84142.1 hypothetical protein SAMN05216226_11049 [Halovenus aranensis]